MTDAQGAGIYSYGELALVDCVVRDNIATGEVRTGIPSSGMLC